MANPYESPQNTPSTSAVRPSRFLFWFSLAIVVIGAILWVSVVASVATDVINGWGSNPKLAVIVAIVFTIVLGAVCVPQGLSVFGRSERWAGIVIWISIAGVIIGLLAAVIYPIAEYNLDNSPRGFEILGAISYSGIAGLFYLNRWLHRRWVDTLRRQRAG